MVRKGLCLLLAFGLLLVNLGLNIPRSYADSVTQLTLPTIADSYVNSDTAYVDRNYGSKTTLFVKSGYRVSYLKFDLSSIASASDVQSATLRLNGSSQSSGNTSTIHLFGVSDDSWTESGITWNTKPTPDAAEITSGTVADTEQDYDFDVTSYIQGQVGGDDTASIYLDNLTGYSASFSSKEGANPPQLIIQMGDSAPPSAPGSLAATVSSATDIQLSWSAATDDDGVTGYNIYMDGTLAGTSIGPSYHVSGLSSSTTYSFYVTAFDAAGNESSASSSVNATTQALSTGTTYYVDPSGGGQPNTYTTIASALAASLLPGDTIVIKDGIYVENPKITKSGSQGNFITVMAEGDNAVIKGNMTISGSYVRVQGLNFDGALTSGGFISNGIKAGSSEHVEIVHNTITDFNLFAISGGVNSYIADNYIYDCAGGINPGEGSLIERNEVVGINVHGDDVNNPGDNFRALASDLVFRNNYGHGTSQEFTLTTHVDCIQTFDTNGAYARNVLFENNKFTGWFSQGVMMQNTKYPDQTHASDWIIRNNIFQGMTGNGVWAGKTNDGIPNLVIENNLFYGNYDEGCFNAITATGPYSSVSVRNNIFVNFTDNGLRALSGASIDSDYNLYYNSIGSQIMGPNDIFNLDPQFVDEANFDFHLSANSPAINSGLAISSLSSDKDGNPRPANGAFDIGPYEFQGTSSDIPPVVTLLSPVNADVYAVDSSMYITVNARDDDSVTKVEFELDGQKVGESTTAPFDYTIQNLTEGIHLVRVVAYDNDGLSSGSNEARIVVTDEATYKAEAVWSNTSISQQTGTFTAAFDVIPLNENMNGVIGFGQSDAAAYSDMATLLRFNPDGYIDAMNSTAYSSVDTLSYQAGTKYSVVMAVDVVNHTYSAYVTPEGGTQQTIADDYAFRSQQAAVSALDRLVMYAADGNYMELGLTITP
ncbi:DNRLRE domain-containing protein [Paenibacillus sp. HB172176]|uniref:CBM96 family carbohydrate-binding protein n=1 Tax=Paenibacillus sp. HB172176 TaxID=2493690 RepID=UPI00143AB8DB|nr:DNRLRE domain-containing protein [Paenibacillus sp. HB172176]